nr:MAG TPA: hypothetical protein [Caudoviricetes sp.]
MLMKALGVKRQVAKLEGATQSWGYFGSKRSRSSLVAHSKKMATV